MREEIIIDIIKWKEFISRLPWESTIRKIINPTQTQYREKIVSNPSLTKWRSLSLSSTSAGYGGVVIRRLKILGVRWRTSSPSSPDLFSLPSGWNNGCWVLFSLMLPSRKLSPLTRRRRRRLYGRNYTAGPNWSAHIVARWGLKRRLLRLLPKGDLLVFTWIYHFCCLGLLLVSRSWNIHREISFLRYRSISVR